MKNIFVNLKKLRNGHLTVRNMNNSIDKVIRIKRHQKWLTSIEYTKKIFK